MATKKPDPAAAAAAAPAAPRLRFEPTPGCPEPMPGIGGNWLRHPDGGLAPADEATALAAGLGWAPADTSTPTPTDTPKE